MLERYAVFEFIPKFAPILIEKFDHESQAVKMAANNRKYFCIDLLEAKGLAPVSIG